MQDKVAIDEGVSELVIWILEAVVHVQPESSPRCIQISCHLEHDEEKGAPMMARVCAAPSDLLY